jgi:hypothetical protein
MRYGPPKRRLREMWFFLKFELYNLICVLSGYRITHWLDQKPAEPAGKYLRVVRPAPFLVRMMDRKFVFGEEAHSHYISYSLEEAGLKAAGSIVSIVEISYRVSVEVY